MTQHANRNQNKVKNATENKFSMMSIVFEADTDNRVKSEC